MAVHGGTAACAAMPTQERTMGDAGGSRRPVVLLLAPWFGPGYHGGAPRLFDLLLGSVRAFDVHVLTGMDRTTREQAAAWDRRALAERGYRVHRDPGFHPALTFPPGASAPTKALATLRHFGGVRRAVRDCLASVRPSLVVAGDSFRCGWLMERLPPHIARANYVLGEELTTPWTGVIPAWLRRAQGRALRGADLDIAVSRYSAARVVELAGVAPERCVVLPSAVDTSVFRPPADRAALRRALGWEGRTVLLSLSRQDERKGTSQVLHALHASRSVPPDWHFVIGGTGDQDVALRELADALGLAQRVTFLGFVPEQDLPALFGAADLFVQPNRDIAGDTEGFGIVFLEAGACGTPVLGGIAGGTADAIEHGVTGLRVDGDDADAVREGIEQLLADPERLRRMGAAGLARVREGFTPERLAGRLEGFFAQALSRHALAR